MPGFRYAQFCPVARACELLASRWTLLIVRDLLIGPRRFSDLKRSLPGISASVLSERLAALETHGVVERKELPPPAASSVYALTEVGQALRPALVELLRWGLRFMADTRPDDHLEPAWLPLGLAATARRGPAPARRIGLRIPDAHGPIEVVAEGGPTGTALHPGAGDAEVWLEADPRSLLLFAAGLADPLAAVGAGRARAEGDVSALRDLAGLFEMAVDRNPE